MGTQMDYAKRELFGAEGLAVTNFKLFPGSSREVTPQRFAEQVNKVVAQLEEGDYELVEAED